MNLQKSYIVEKEEVNPMYMSSPKNISYENLQTWLNTKDAKAEEPMKVIARSELIKVGGLYRIRDNYTPVWKLHKGEDGKDYIVRMGDDEVAGETMRVADDDESQSLRKAYRIVQAHKVYTIWECENCQYSNITRQGHIYKCDQCQEKFAHVMDDEKVPPQEVYTRVEARQSFGPDIERRMIRAGISKAHISLIDDWKREAGEAVNPWAVCHTTVDKKKNPEKYERCVKDIKKKQPTKSASEKTAVDFAGLGIGQGSGGGSNIGPSLMNMQPPTTLATGKAPPCPYEGCRRSFPDGGTLKDHLRVDHNIRASNDTKDKPWKGRPDRGIKCSPSGKIKCDWHQSGGATESPCSGNLIR